ncbi:MULTISPECIES: hypothetical protein [Niastella]|uniref:DUF1735 domain-containing protein n=1 Tax=Niastella soli TaxID=2821487 RepID=A0ABS3Z4F3_9BACT|nr:hypothetical protein [Niastella soli]MBO9205038.1 hypothetical protein [Niastella soli]
MRTIALSILAVVMSFMVACDDHDVLPPYTPPPTVFNLSSISHVRDTILSKGDTLKFKVVGYVKDTVPKYSIAITLKAVDSVTNVQLSGNLMKTFKVKYDTVDFYKTNMIRFTNADTNAIYMTIPAIPAGTKIRSTATFAYGLNLSSQMGTTSLTVKNNGFTR